jgi:signal transduction histidine kinase
MIAVLALKNPLHAISNLADTLIEHSAAMETSPLSSPLAPPLSEANVLLLSSLPGHFDSTRIPPQPSTPDSVVPAARGIGLCSKYMLSLVSDVLDVERFENGSVKLQPSATDLKALLEGAIALGREVAKPHGIGFEGRIGEDVPNMVEVDWARMIQAINNVINDWYV